MADKKTDFFQTQCINYAEEMCKEHGHSIVIGLTNYRKVYGGELKRYCTRCNTQWEVE